MNQLRLGPQLVFIGIFGGGLLWLFACVARFDYLINEVYNGGGPGEAIWIIDPVFTIIAALPGLFLVLFGFIFTLWPNTDVSGENASDRVCQPVRVKYLHLNLLYLGENFLLVTAIVGFIAAFGTSSSAIEMFLVSSIVFAAIAVTCGLNLMGLLWYLWKGVTDSEEMKRLAKTTLLILAIELIVLASIFLALRLHTWRFVRMTTIVIQASGCFSLLLLALSIIVRRNSGGAEGEI